MDAFEREIQQDSVLRNEAVRLAAYDALTGAQCYTRQHITKSAAAYVPKTYSKEMQEEVERRSSKWFSWPLMCGILLRNANKEQILEDAVRYQQMADGNARNAKFLRLVAGRLKGKQKVKDVLSEDEIGGLMQEAVGGEEGKAGEVA